MRARAKGFWGLALALALTSAAWGAEIRGRGWYDVGILGGADGTDKADGIWRHVTSIRVTCTEGNGRLRMVWIEDGGRRFQWSAHRKMGEGDWALQPLGCQRVTGVRIFTEGDARYHIELHLDSRREEK